MPPFPGDTGIEGVVLIGPQCPVVREGEDCPDKPYHAQIEVYDPVVRRTVASTSSDADGRFRLLVPPGTYTLIPLPEPGGIARAPEQTVVVIAGALTRVTVVYDSGIR